ncbi:MAG: hypothetical protein L6V95_09510 [Candidatus Melainabacteria bacterium]|nr:MAG: hypothetical protein L6V95_09510 [Candidatus Melainabacteria bacterium]
MYIEKKEKGFALNKLYNPNDVPLTEDYKTIYTYLVSVKDIKPFSITSILQDELSHQNNLCCTKNSLENEFIKIEIDENNKVNIFDKQKNKLYKKCFHNKKIWQILAIVITLDLLKMINLFLEK